MKRPTKITPDPIIDAVVELRYESAVPPDAILGMLFAQVQSKYTDFKKLPAATLPEEIRKSDPGLRFSPYYQAEAEPFKLNVGPRVISLSNTGEYSGWKEAFFPELKELFEKVKQAGIVKRFFRLGVRYIDFFELDIYDKTNLTIRLNDKPLESLQTTLSAVFRTGDFSTRLQTANNVTVNVKGSKQNGSIIDTDTYFEDEEGFNFEGLPDLMDKCHEESVTFFFSLLQQDFLETLKPEYSE
ncbi:MAG TPA: TIGR04255 family protein [Desulfobulbus sp.]|nr:TIGR04255 family protein [Desulfobulbus sp.]